MDTKANIEEEPMKFESVMALHSEYYAITDFIMKSHIDENLSTRSCTTADDKTCPSIEAVSVPQWISANASILMKLVDHMDTLSIKAYLRYNIKIGEYLQITDVASVMKLDDAHRRSVAVEGQRWDDINQNTVNTFVHKRVDESDDTDENDDSEDEVEQEVTDSKDDPCILQQLLKPSFHNAPQEKAVAQELSKSVSQESKPLDQDADMKELRSEAEPTRKEKPPSEPSETPCTCHTCGTTYMQTDFLKHLSNHTDERDYNCEVHGKTFTYYGGNKTQTSEKPYHCHFCQKKYSKLSWLKTHVVSHAKGIVFMCTDCNNPYTKAQGHLYGKCGENIAAEAEQEDQKKPIQFKCNPCEREFFYFFELKKHIKTHKGDQPFDCKACTDRFAFRADLQKHMETHGEKPFVCSICNKAYRKKSLLKSHEAVHFGERPFRCDTCEKSFLTLPYLEKHMLSHSSERPTYKCEFCDKTVKLLSSLKEHIDVHHNFIRHICQVCKKACKTKKSLQNHMKIHTGDRPYKCDLCGKTFIQAGALNIHMMNHQGVKPFQCDTCSMRFPTKSGLKKHHMTHSDEKPYMCDICGNQFNSQDSVERHKLRVHVGEKPHQCNVCGKGFATNGDLIKHTRVHTGEKPYICDVCGRAFRDPSNRRQHMKTHKMFTM